MEFKRIIEKYPEEDQWQLPSPDVIPLTFGLVLSFLTDAFTTELWLSKTFVFVIGLGVLTVYGWQYQKRETTKLEDKQTLRAYMFVSALSLVSYLLLR